jgi:hypothetical protein
MATVPTITVIGSCRVDDPIRQMEAAGRATMNQQNIYGYVHNSREVLQQLDILAGRIDVPTRLRPFLNIRGKWASHAASTNTVTRFRFARTDAFVVEISSIRLLRFKAMFLQINRTREILVTSPALEANWWGPLLRLGKNDVAAYQASCDGDVSSVHAEVAKGAICSEQSLKSVRDDILAINELLPAPVLFVSHFNTTASGAPVRQRQLIVEAMQQAAAGGRIAWFDPTGLVREAGPEHAILDPSHYQENFIPKVGEALMSRLEELIEQRRAKPRPAFDLYEMQRD